MDTDEYIRRVRRGGERKNSMTEDADEPKSKSKVRKQNKVKIEDMETEGEKDHALERKEDVEDWEREYEKENSFILGKKKIAGEDTGHVIERKDSVEDWEVECEKDDSYILDVKNIKHKKDTNHVDDSKKTVDKLRVEIWDLTEANDKLKKDKNEYLSEKKKYDRYLEQLMEEKLKLEKAQEDLNKQLEGAENKLQALDQEIQILKDEKQTLLKHQKDTNVVDDNKDTVASLQTQIEELTYKVNSLEQENSVLSNQRMSYKNILEELREKNSILLTAQKDLKDKFAVHIKQTEEDGQKLKQHYQNGYKELVTENSTLLNAQKDLTDKIAVYVKELEEAKNQLKQSYSFRESLNQEIQILNDDKQTLQNIQDRYQYSIFENQKQLKEYETKLIENQKVLKEYEMKLSEEMAKHETQIAVLEEENKQANNERESFLQETLSLKNRINVLNYEIKSLRDDIAQRKEQEEIDIEQIESLKEDIKYLNEEKDELYTEKTEWERTIAEYQDKTSSYEKRLEEYSKTLKEGVREFQSLLKQEKADARNQLEEFESKFNEDFRNLEDWAAAADSTRNVLQAKVADLTRKTQSWCEEKKELSLKLSAMTEQNKKLSEELKRQKNTIEDKNKVIASLIAKKDVEALKEKVAEREKRTDDDIMQLKAKVAQNESLERKVDELQFRNAHLVNSIEYAATKYKAVGEKMVNSSSEVFGLRGRINEIYNHLQEGRSELHETVAGLNEIIKKRKRGAESQSGQCKWK